MPRSASSFWPARLCQRRVAAWRLLARPAPRQMELKASPLASVVPART